MQVVKDIYSMWRHTYKTDKLTFWLGATGTFSSIIASIIFNVGLPDPNLWAVLILYTIGSVTLSISAYHTNDSWLIMLMTWYTFINGVGMVQLILNG
jgi:hypothetical protein